MEQSSIATTNESYRVVTALRESGVGPGNGPPALEKSDPRFPGNDRRYAGLAADRLPLCESLEDTVARVVALWREEIAPEVALGKRVIIAAHGNSLRALVQHLDGMAKQDVVGLNIPTGIPLVYDLDDDLKPLRHRYMGDDDAIKAAIASVAGRSGIER